MKGLLLAGGHGTRLRPLTYTGNKHMIPIANEPMLFYGLRHLVDVGIEEVAIIFGPIHEGIEEAVGDGRSFGLRVRYIEQGEPKGLAHAVLCAREFLGEEPFVMYLGDNLLRDGPAPLIRRFGSERADAVIGVTPVTHPSNYGVVEMDGDRIVTIVEKPPAPKSDLALIGVYLFTPKILPIIERLTPSKRGELEITDAIWQLHQTGGRVLVERVEGWWKDTGRPEDLLEANEKVLKDRPLDYFQHAGMVAPGAEIIGPVRLGKGSYVAAGCRVEGPSVLGDGVRVEAGAIIGPGTAIGERSVVRQSHLAHSIVMEQVEIDGPVQVANSIVGRFSTIHASGERSIRLSAVLGDSTQIRL